MESMLIYMVSTSFSHCISRSPHAGCLETRCVASCTADNTQMISCVSFSLTCFAFYCWSHCRALFKVDNGNSSPQLNAFSFGKLTTYTPKVLPTKFVESWQAHLFPLLPANKVAGSRWRREGATAAGCGFWCCLKKIWKIDWEKTNGRLEEPCELFNFMWRRYCCCNWNLCLQLARKNKNCIFMTQGALFVLSVCVCNQIKYCCAVVRAAGKCHWYVKLAQHKTDINKNQADSEPELEKQSRPLRPAINI